MQKGAILRKCVNTFVPHWVLDMRKDVEADRLGDQQCDVEAEALMHKVTYTLGEAEALNLGDTWEMSTPKHWSIS